MTGNLIKRPGPWLWLCAAVFGFSCAASSSTALAQAAYGAAVTAVQSPIANPVGSASVSAPQPTISLQSSSLPRSAPVANPPAAAAAVPARARN
jgi:hypothetical protein